MNENLKTRCVISGGGPAGIMLGYLLARAGIDTVILEKWPDFFRDFRGDTVHPSTMETLKELGLLPEFLTLPHSEMTQMTLHFGGVPATVADMKYLNITCPFIAFVPQWDFLNFLAQKGKQYPAFRLMMETEALDLIKENGRVVGVRAKNKEGEFDIRAELVVGADGRHSMVREKGGFELHSFGVPIDVLWFRVARIGKDDKRSLGYIDRGLAMVMLDRADYWQCAFIIQKGRFDEIKAEGLPAFRKKVMELGNLSEEVVAEIDSWDKVKFLSVTVDRVKTWAADGVLLIGDAAHAMSPMGGVGINYAVQDAVAAGNILIPAFKKGTPDLKTLAKIQTRREPPVKKMQGLQVFLQDRIFGPILNQRGHLKAPFIIRLFDLFPPLRRILAHIIGIGFLPEHVAPETGLVQ